MGTCYIQKLEQVKDGWHIRFGGPSDIFWTMLSNFKAEQKRAGQMFCSYNPRFFGGQGGWFCTDAILQKYSSDFENYADMRQKAETAYAESGKAEQARKEAEAKKAKEEEYWRQWEQTKRDYEQRREKEKQQNYSYRQPTRPPSTALTLTEAKVELGLSPLAQLTEKEVKKAFRLKAMQTHPDHGGTHEAMVKLNQAYQLVMFHVVKVGVRS